MSKCYRMDGSLYDGPDPLMEWARDLEDSRGRIIGQDALWNGLWISTVWLGLDHSFGHGPPLIFETMVFDHLNGGSGVDLDQQRYSTLAQAERGHRDMMREYSRFWPTVRRWLADAMKVEDDLWWED